MTARRPTSEESRVVVRKVLQANGIEPDHTDLDEMIRLRVVNEDLSQQLRWAREKINELGTKLMMAEKSFELVKGLLRQLVALVDQKSF